MSIRDSESSLLSNIWIILCVSFRLKRSKNYVGTCFYRPSGPEQIPCNCISAQELLTPASISPTTKWTVIILFYFLLLYLFYFIINFKSYED